MIIARHVYAHHGRAAQRQRQLLYKPPISLAAAHAAMHAGYKPRKAQFGHFVGSSSRMPDEVHYYDNGAPQSAAPQEDMTLRATRTTCGTSGPPDPSTRSARRWEMGERLQAELDALNLGTYDINQTPGCRP
jgi:hypothetical protein